MLLADLAQQWVSRHPRIALAAESVEDAAADVAEWLGVRVALGVDTVADTVAHAGRVARIVRNLDVHVDAVNLLFAEYDERLTVLEALEERRAKRVADILARDADTQASFDRVKSVLRSFEARIVELERGIDKGEK